MYSQYWLIYHEHCAKFYKTNYISTNFVYSKSNKECSSDSGVNGVFKIFAC